MLTLHGRCLAAAADSFTVDLFSSASPRQVTVQGRALALSAGETYARGGSPQIDALLAMMSRGVRLTFQVGKDTGRVPVAAALLPDPEGRVTGLVFFDGDRALSKPLAASASGKAHFPERGHGD